MLVNARLLALALALSVPAAAADVVAIIAGQSNAAGATVVPLASDQEEAPRLFAAYTGDRVPGFVAHNSKKHMRVVLPAVEPLGYGTGATKMGFGRLAGIDIAAGLPGDNVILYMNATGGTATSFTDPATYEFSPPLRELQQHATIVGILFHQGETEASKTTTTQAGHAAALDAYLASWREWTGIPCLPLVAGDLGSATQPPSYPTAPQVRAALADWPARDVTSGCGKVAWIPSTDAPVTGAHFTHAGLEVMAARYAAALLEMVP